MITSQMDTTATLEKKKRKMNKPPTKNHNTKYVSEGIQLKTITSQIESNLITVETVLEQKPITPNTYISFSETY